MPALTVLFLGDNDCPEFRKALAALRAAAEVTVAVGPAEATARWPYDDREPDLIVLAQQRPGEFSLEAVAALRACWPLARIVGLLGTWCEGEARSGRPWPAVPRRYWHDWLAHWRRDRERMRAGRLPSWSLPMTSAEDERLLDVVEGDEPPLAAAAVVAVSAAEAPLGDWLCDACRAGGYWPLALRPPWGRISGAAAGIWDGRLDSPGGGDQLAAFVAAVAPAPVLAVLGFPRIEQVEQALATGACVVVSKPLLADALLAELARLVGSAPARHGTAKTTPLAPLASAGD